MGEKLDRGVQRALLHRLRDAYPVRVQAKDLQSLAEGTSLRVNVAYLGEHGLIEATFYENLSSGPTLGQARITARGLDFLAEDGGLSAILGVVTVRLHEDTLKELVAAKIQASDLPRTEKQRFLDQLRSLPGETTKHLVLRLVDAGLDNWQRALPLLQNMLQQG